MSACGSSTLPWFSGQMSSSPVPDCCPVGARSTLDPPGFEETAGRRADRGHEETAGQPAAQGGAPLGRLGLEHLDGGHAADHEPGVGPGAQGVEGDVQGVLVAGQLEVDQRQEQWLGPDAAQGGDEVRRHGPGCGRPGSGRRRHPSCPSARAGSARRPVRVSRCAVP